MQLLNWDEGRGLTAAVQRSEDNNSRKRSVINLLYG
jgi:hypothetical protein